jgi:hypothetical protein
MSTKNLRTSRMSNADKSLVWGLVGEEEKFNKSKIR